jgi:uncharacterized RDD family membrane protein YckC
VVIAAPSDYVGSAALSLHRHEDVAAHPEVRKPDVLKKEASAQPVTGRAEPERQPALFSTLQTGPKVIPFEQAQRHATARAGLHEPIAAASPVITPIIPVRPAPARPQVRRPSLPAEAQGSLDFIVAPASRARTLKTNVEAQVYCDQPVATPMHRFVAGAIDSALILLAFGLFVIVCQAVGGSFGQGKLFWISLAMAFVVVSLFYGLIWAISGRETAGMRMTDLQLITFDGFPVDGPTRALRFVSTWLSFCSGAIGLVWSLADEESLTWHDHISKTFPTFKDEPRNFVRER